MCSDASALMAVPRLEKQFSFSGKFSNSDIKKNSMLSQNIVGSRNVTFLEEQARINPEINAFN